jgi:hypothetical protein
MTALCHGLSRVLCSFAVFVHESISKFQALTVVFSASVYHSELASIVPQRFLFAATLAHHENDGAPTAQ